MHLLESRSEFVIVPGFAKGIPAASFAHVHANSEPRHFVNVLDGLLAENLRLHSYDMPLPSFAHLRRL